MLLGFHAAYNAEQVPEETAGGDFLATSNQSATLLLEKNVIPSI
jgi:hypothetical protein